MKYVEVEFKYRADEISLTSFESFCRDKNPKKYVLASGYDHFYDRKGDPNSFCRHRTGPDSNQLTFKRKTVDTNNFVRTEHNLDLFPTMTEDQVKALCSEFGYEHNTSIFKNCFVYKYDWYTLVYYICYSTDLKEIGRFVEIEMCEHHPWASEQEALGALVTMEKLCCKALGISPQARIKRSLYEIFRK